MSKARPVILLVLGVHRSGTSVVARMMECIGAVPSVNLHEPLPNNPTGFFEDLDVERFNEYEVLPALGARWHDVVPPDWERLDEGRRAAFSARAEEIIRRNFDLAQPLAVLKEPRIMTLLPLWLAVLQRIGYEVRVVGAVRDPLSVARSLHARDGLPIAHGASLFASNWGAAARSIAGLRCSFVRYDAVLDDARAELLRIASELSIDLPPDFDARMESFRSGHLDLSLRHGHATPDELDAHPELPRVALDTFRDLVAASAAGAGAGQCVIDRFSRESEPWMPLLRAHDGTIARVAFLRQDVANLGQEVAGLRSHVATLESRLAQAPALAAEVQEQLRQLSAWSGPGDSVSFPA